MKLPKTGLLTKILIAIAMGIITGLFFLEWMVRIFVTINGIFSQFLGFIIPLIIIGLVTPAISDIGKTAGRMLLADGCHSLWFDYNFRIHFVPYRSGHIPGNDRCR